jgi:hypothetical protein
LPISQPYPDNDSHPQMNHRFFLLLRRAVDKINLMIIYLLKNQRVQKHSLFLRHACSFFLNYAK